MFDHDWFATPFVMTTCQVRPVKVVILYNCQENGAFDDPAFEEFKCVLRKFSAVLLTTYYGKIYHLSRGLIMEKYN